MSLITLDNVSFSYDKTTPVIKNVSFSVERGENVAVIGHNGSGKSTLAKLLNALVKADQGKVIVDGIEAQDKNSTFEVRRKVGVVFQNPDNQLVASIVEDDIAFGPENLGVKREEIGKRIDFALKAVGMEKFRKSSPERLSGGQKQRIAIAGVLALMPEVLVLDESTAMLDPIGRKEVLQVVKKLNKENGTTVINITHYMDEAARADRVIVLSDGQLMLDGTPGEVFTHSDTLRRVGLDLPQCTAVSQYLITHDIPIHGEINTPEQCAEAILNAWKKI